jgi:hypothetical protein
MSNFLDIADGLRHSGELTHPYNSAFDRVFKARSQLQSVHSKAQLNLHNIESVFGAFEVARRFKKSFGTLTQEEVQELGRSMRLLIAHTLERTTRFGLGHEKVIPPHPYGAFADHLKKLKTKSGVAIITFNYDIGLDTALELKEMPVEYCLQETLQGGSCIPVIKLHGSLNWGRCGTCKKVVVPWHMSEMLRSIPIGGIHARDVYLYAGDFFFIKITSAMGGHVHDCRTAIDAFAPVIVPPTWEKASHDQGFENMWAHAAGFLARAENIIAIGYSLPTSDQFFPMLYALGTVSDTILKRFWVFDPDPDAAVEKRFLDMLGPAAKHRFKHFRIPFGEAFQYLSPLENER